MTNDHVYNTQFSILKENQLSYFFPPQSKQWWLIQSRARPGHSLSCPVSFALVFPVLEPRDWVKLEFLKHTKTNWEPFLPFIQSTLFLAVEICLSFKVQLEAASYHSGRKCFLTWTFMLLSSTLKALITSFWYH